MECQPVTLYQCHLYITQAAAQITPKQPNKVGSINTERKGNTNTPVDRVRKYKQKMWQNLYTHTHTHTKKEKKKGVGEGGVRKGHPISSITEHKLNTAPHYCIRQDSYSNWPSQCTQTLQTQTQRKKGWGKGGLERVTQSPQSLNTS